MGPEVILSTLTFLLHLIGSVNPALSESASHTSTKERLLAATVSCPYPEKYVNAYLSGSSSNSSSSVWASDRFEVANLSSSWHSAHASAAQNVTNKMHFGFAQHSHCANKKRMKYGSVNSGPQWSSANVELFQAVAKITILVLLKIIIKYYIRGYLKAHIDNKAIFELIELTSKALTIAIAKCAIKWALYPALRTAAKTFLIASLKSMVKPFSSPLIKGVKGASLSLIGTVTKFTLTLSVKVVIKTIALQMLMFVFENEATQLALHQLMFRVSLILMVKMSAKRVCKMGKNKSSPSKGTDDPSSDMSAPVDKIMMFAIQKLVTKLVKIPLIKILL